MRVLRLLTLLYIFISAAFLSSCGSEEDEKKFIIGFSQCTEGDAWRRAMHEEMLREVSFYPELDLKIKDAHNSSTEQIKDIQEFIAQGVDLLIVSPNEAQPITPVVEKAFEKGIPVIVVDRKTNSSMYSAYVGANNFQIGKLAGEYIANMLNGKGRIIEVWGLRGSSPAIERHKGFMEVISEYPDIKIVAEVNGEWEKEVAKERFPAVFNTTENVDLVLAHNDVMALGAYESLSNSVKQKELKFVGFDGLGGPNAGLQFVEDGILDATFLYPTGGEEVIQLAYDVLRNKPFKKENILNSTVIDDRNVHIMKQQSNKIISQEQNIERQQARISEQIKIYNNQRTLLYILLVALVVIIVLGALVLQVLRAKQEANKALLAKNAEVINQRNEIALMAKKADKATEAKIKFFTNISHEFRTPLTLILGPVEDALQSNVAPKLKDDLQLVKKNANRLLNLVNQLMDFRKIERKKMKLQAAEGDIVLFIKDIASAFEHVAAKRQIVFQVNTNPAKLNLYFDADKLDKIMFNLLSNAFKYTKEGGKISVNVALSDKLEDVVIAVEDNGKGMNATQVAHAFDRFYSSETASSLGTGLGLALSREFVKLHKGDITVSSQEGVGTKFTIELPLGKAHLEEDEIIPNTAMQATPLQSSVQDTEQSLNNEALKTEKAKAQKEYTVLLIEDNHELREFLKKRLNTEFNVVEAPNGTFGLTKALETVPDLIVCDVMMPGQNGLELTAALKNDLRTSHIPVILLTAKDRLEYKIEGIQSGADLYVTKPFSYQYLYERMKGLIRNREILKAHYSSDISLDNKTISPPKQLDKKFLNDVLAVVEKELSNTKLNADIIAQNLGMSRVQVYRKMKALLGYSVNDYVNNVRLKKARHLLRHSEMNISEIAYEVGFSSPAYFSTAFKNSFNLTPTEFKTARINGEEKDAIPA